MGKNPALFDSPPPWDKAHQDQRSEMADKGFVPYRWVGTDGRLKDAGIERRGDAGNRGRGRGWAERWAVFIAEADPAGDECRQWALLKARDDLEEFREAIDTVIRLSKSQSEAYSRVAEFIVEAWEPEDD